MLDAIGSERIGPHDSVLRADGPDRGDDRILRAKYLDWCSARVAERFLRLTPDQIYELAHTAVEGSSPGPGPRARDPSSPDSPRSTGDPAFSQKAGDDPESYRRIVEAVTRALTAELHLPGFEEWRAAYQAAPEQFDDELLGFWREGI